MGHLMDAFTRNARGGISTRRFDSDQFPGPTEGWYDAPDKVPPLPGQNAEPKVPEVRTSQAEATISANLGTNDRKALTDAPPKPRGQGRRGDGTFKAKR